jgi:rhodanese-related sulfurtransferase
MRTSNVVACMGLGIVVFGGWMHAGAVEPIPNRLIDYAQFQKIVATSAVARENHRLKENEFLAAIKESGVIVLDARSASAYRLRHIDGAVNLPFTDFTAETLAQVIPRKDAKVMIYCNNNFTGSPAAFATKAPAASLNLSTYTSLVAYGYTNLYELGPLLDVKSTKIPFAGTEVAVR